MSYTISKELFEAVMGLDKNEVSEMYVSGKDIFWHTYEDEFERNKDSKINIDSLCFVCKEWAYNQGYDLVVKRKYHLNPFVDDFYFECNIEKYSNRVAYYENESESELSEQQAVFDACMYILDIKKEG